MGLARDFGVTAAVAGGIVVAALAVTGGILGPVGAGAAESGRVLAGPAPTPEVVVRTAKDRPAAPRPRCAEVEGVVVVANFNIKAGKAGAGGRLPEIAEQLRGWDPDVVLLQEVDRFRAGSGNVDQAAWLGEQLGYEHVFGANLRSGGGEYGTAILSRHPIVTSENVALPNRPGAEQRGLLKAVVRLPGRDVSFYTTHLQSRRVYAGLRAEQAREVVRILDADENPTVIGGDFNSGPSVEAMRVMRERLTDTWAVSGRGDGATWPATGARGRIDYLLHHGVDALGAVVTPSGLSDHLPLRAAYSYTYDRGRNCGEGPPNG